MPVLRVLFIATVLSAILILSYPIYFLGHFGTNQGLPVSGCVFGRVGGWLADQCVPQVSMLTAYCLRILLGKQ